MLNIRTQVNRETASKISYVATKSGLTRRHVYGALLDEVAEKLTPEGIAYLLEGGELESAATLYGTFRDREDEGD